MNVSETCVLTSLFYTCKAILGNWNRGGFEFEIVLGVGLKSPRHAVCCVVLNLLKQVGFCHLRTALAEAYRVSRVS